MQASLSDQMDYRVDEDINLIQDLLSCSREDLARQCSVSVATINRWARGDIHPSRELLESLYGFAFKRGLRLNRIKEQLFVEDARTAKILFHGAKSFLDGPLSLSKSRGTNDFGQGFYCGETFEQAAMFVAGYDKSSVYAFEFHGDGLESVRFGVERDWMLTVALYRGKLGAYRGAEQVEGLRSRLESADYVVAPIADNRMFEIIDSFVDGEITDVQCQHCLSATDLGMQYVCRTQRALDALTCLERCYLCDAEKSAYLAERAQSSRVGIDKVKVARRQYRGEGRYIEELFDEGC